MCAHVLRTATPLFLLRPAPCVSRKFERFFEHFHEYDIVVVATFPTCHDPTLRELLRLRLPQRVIVMVGGAGQGRCVCSWEARRACQQVA